MKLTKTLKLATMLIATIMIFTLVSFSAEAEGPETCAVTNNLDDMQENSLQWCLLDRSHPVPNIIDLTQLGNKVNEAARTIPLNFAIILTNGQQLKNSGSNKVILTFAEDMNGDKSCLIKVRKDQTAEVIDNGGIKLSKLDIRNNDGNGICINNQKTSITNSIISAPNGDGIVIERLADQPNTLISGTTISLTQIDAVNGIRIEDGGDNAEISLSGITATQSGIIINDADNIDMMFNRITGKSAVNSNGIDINDSSNNWTTGNMITLFADGINISNGTNNKVITNFFNYAHTDKPVKIANGANGNLQAPIKVRTAFVTRDAFYITGLVSTTVKEIHIYQADKADHGVIGGANGPVAYSSVTQNPSEWMPIKLEQGQQLRRFVIKIDKKNKYLTDDWQHPNANGATTKMIDITEATGFVVAAGNTASSEFSTVINASRNSELNTVAPACAGAVWFFDAFDRIENGANGRAIVVDKVWTDYDYDRDSYKNGDEDLDKDCVIDNGESDPANINSTPDTIENNDDADGDDVSDALDNCVSVKNADQKDMDDDGVGDVCDNCVDEKNPDQANSDDDQFGNACDNCYRMANDDQADTDGDGFGNSCDTCPELADETNTDSDGDGIGDACDNCPARPNPNQVDICNGGNDGETDDNDGDGILNAADNCPDDANADQTDIDRDGIGDMCDPVDDTPTGGLNEACNPDDTCNEGLLCIADICKEKPIDILDSDSDGIPDILDNCPANANPDQLDTDKDGKGDLCADINSLSGKGGCSLLMTGATESTSATIYLLLTIAVFVVARKRKSVNI